jgi:hypothetical protein
MITEGCDYWLSYTNAVSAALTEVCMHSALELAVRRMFSCSDICLKETRRSLKNLRHEFRILTKIRIVCSQTHDSYATNSVNLVRF